jgi:hypothetical protein
VQEAFPETSSRGLVVFEMYICSAFIVDRRKNKYTGKLCRMQQSVFGGGCYVCKMKLTLGGLHVCVQFSTWWLARVRILTHVSFEVFQHVLGTTHTLWYCLTMRLKTKKMHILWRAENVRSGGRFFLVAYVQNILTMVVAVYGIYLFVCTMERFKHSNGNGLG